VEAIGGLGLKEEAWWAAFGEFEGVLLPPFPNQGKFPI